MPSDTDIANMALAMLGQTPLVTLNDSSDSGRACKVLYAPMRDALLREIPWSFARKWVALNQLSPGPINLDILPLNHGPGAMSFTGSFALPTDCLRVYRFSPQDAHWRVVGSAIYTDAVPPASPAPTFGTQPLGPDGTDNQPGQVSTPTGPTLIGIEYIVQVIDPNQFDPMFVDCLATKLAAEIAFAVTGLEAQQDRMAQHFQQKLTEAAAVNGMGNWPDQLYDTAVADVRYGYSYLTTGFGS